MKRLCVEIGFFAIKAIKQEGAYNMPKKKMTRSEAGKKGGNATMKKHGTEFYQKIGKKGGKIGGATTKERHGTEFFQEIGRKGGLK
jgi:general stress protein YciG